jgi:hypothetical protein
LRCKAANICGRNCISASRSISRKREAFEGHEVSFKGLRQAEGEKSADVVSGNNQKFGVDEQ